MTDIDAIRELRAFLLGEGPLDGTEFGERNRTIPGLYWWRREARVRIDALLSAYDAKCEELANACALGASLSSDLDAALIRISQLESRLRADLEHIRPLELGALSAFEQKYDAMRAERDAAHREKAAAMGLVEGHALTIAKLEAERDAAVRDAQRYRWLRNRGYIAGINGRPFCVYDGKAYRYGYELDDAIDAQLAALAPPTEPLAQPKVAT